MSAMASEPSLYLSSKNKLSKQKKENKVNHNDSAADFYKSLTAQGQDQFCVPGFFLGSNEHEFIEGLCWNEKVKKDEEKNMKDPLLFGVELLLHTDGCGFKSLDYFDKEN
jgi:hypothetical protein